MSVGPESLAKLSYRSLKLHSRAESRRTAGAQGGLPPATTMSPGEPVKDRIRLMLRLAHPPF
jgi:hypothetical protein